MYLGKNYKLYAILFFFAHFKTKAADLFRVFMDALQGTSFSIQPLHMRYFGILKTEV